jgi:hypothetical protein
VNVRGLPRRVTFAGTSSTTTVEPGGAERRLKATDDDSSGRPRDDDSAAIGGLVIREAFSLVGDFGRARGRPIGPVSVVGPNLRPLVEVMARNVSALLDETSTT